MNAQVLLKYPFVFLVGFVAAYVLTPLCGSVARRVGMMDEPRSGRVHRSPIPFGGGPAIFIAFHLVCASVFLVPWLPFAGMVSLEWWLRFLLVSGSLLVLGLVDDARDLRPLVKLAGQCVVACLAYWMGFRVGNVLGQPLAPLLDFVLTLAWFLTLVNAFNLIDGADGLSAGIALVAAVGIAASLLFRHSPGDVLLLAGFAGACLAFLRYNFYPASVFLGDAGSMFLGFALAALSLSTSSKAPALASIGVPLLAAGVPLFDAMLAVWRRSERFAFSSTTDTGIASRDTEHLHHRLLDHGMSQRKLALLLYGGSALLGGVGLAAMIFHSRATGVFLVAFVLGTYVVVRHLAWIELWESGQAVLRGLARPTWRNRGVVLYPILDATFLALALAASIGIAGFCLGEDVEVKGVWLRIAPLSMGIPFLLLVFSRAYGRVWSLARISEFVLVGAAVCGGILLGLGVLILLDDRNVPFTVAQSLFYMGMAASMVVGSRTVFRVMQDLASSMARRRDPGKGVRRAVVYGAGHACTLFLREGTYRAADEKEKRVVVGIADEDPYLRGRLVHGYRVLGGLSELDHVIGREHIDEILVVGAADDKTLRRIMDIATPRGVRVLQWSTSTTALT